MKVIVLGLVPSKRNGRNSPSIQTLNNWMIRVGIKYFCFDNICDSEEGRSRNEYRLPEIDNCKVIALGNEVSNYLWVKGVKHFLLPHPSPRNRKLNDVNFVHSQLHNCKTFLEGAS